MSSRTIRRQNNQAETMGLPVHGSDFRFLDEGSSTQVSHGALEVEDAMSLDAVGEEGKE
jgi:hypothetical protein